MSKFKMKKPHGAKMPRMPKMARPMPGQNEFSAGDEQAMRQGGPQAQAAPQGGGQVGTDPGEADPNFGGM